MKKIIIITIILILIGLVNASNYVPGNAGHANLWTNTVQAKDGSTVTIQDNLNITDNLCIGGKCFTSFGEEGVGGCDAKKSPIFSNSVGGSISELGAWDMCSLVEVTDDLVLGVTGGCSVYEEDNLWKLENDNGFKCSAQCFNVNCLIDASEINFTGIEGGSADIDLEQVTTGWIPITNLQTYTVDCPAGYKGVTCNFHYYDLGGGGAYHGFAKGVWNADRTSCSATINDDGIYEGELYAECIRVTGGSETIGSGTGGLEYVGTCQANPGSNCKCNTEETIMLLEGNSAGSTGYCKVENQGTSSVRGVCDAASVAHSYFSCFRQGTTGTVSGGTAWSDIKLLAGKPAYRAGGYVDSINPNLRTGNLPLTVPIDSKKTHIKTSWAADLPGQPSNEDYGTAQVYIDWEEKTIKGTSIHASSDGDYATYWDVINAISNQDYSSIGGEGVHATINVDFAQKKINKIPMWYVNLLPTPFTAVVESYSGSSETGGEANLETSYHTTEGTGQNSITCPEGEKVLSCRSYAIPEGNFVCGTQVINDGTTCIDADCYSYIYRLETICGKATGEITTGSEGTFECTQAKRARFIGTSGYPDHIPKYEPGPVEIMSGDPAAVKEYRLLGDPSGDQWGIECNPGWEKTGCALQPGAYYDYYLGSTTYDSDIWPHATACITDNEELAGPLVAHGVSETEISITCCRGSGLSSGDNLWSQNGNEVFYDIGNVGIGVSDPNATLDIGKGVLRAQTHIGYSGLHLMTSEEMPINFTTNSTQRMIIDGSGNIGIGTTNPFTRFEIKGNNVGGVDHTMGLYPDGTGSSAGIIFAGSKTELDAMDTTHDIASIGMGTLDGQFGNNAKAGDFIFSSRIGKDIQLATRTSFANVPTRVMIKNDGNIGIGTTTPTAKLDVAGNIKGEQLCIGNDCRNIWPSTGSVAWSSITGKPAGFADNVDNTGGITASTTVTNYASEVCCSAGWFRSGCSAVDNDGYDTGVKPSGTNCCTGSPSAWASITVYCVI